METIRELLIALGLDVDQAAFVEAIGFEKLLEKGAEKLIETLKELPRALIDVTRETAKWADEIQDAHERTGMSTDSLQQFGYIAGLVGLDAGAMEVSVNHLSRTMAEARDGNVEAGKAFAKLGVHVTDAHGKLRNVDDVLLDMSDGFKKLPTAADRTDAAFKTMGRSGVQMINVIGGGREEVLKLRQEFKDFGIGMDADAIDKAAELNKEFLRLGMIADALTRDFAGPLLDAVKPIVESILEWVKANRALIRTRLVEFGRAVVSVGRFLLDMFVGFGKAVIFVVDNLKFFALVLGGVLLAALATNIGALISSIAWYVALGVAAVVSGLKAAAAWVAAAAPVLLLAALFAALLLILDDVRGFLEGEDSLIGDIGPKWTAFLDRLLKSNGEDPWWLAALKEALRIVTDLDGAFDRLRLWERNTGQQLGRGLGLSYDSDGNPHFADPSLGGGAGGPSAAAASSVAGRPGASGGDTHAQVIINPPPGASPEHIANAVVEQMEEFHNRKNREAMAAVGGR